MENTKGAHRGIIADTTATDENTPELIDMKIPLVSGVFIFSHIFQRQK